MPKRSNDFQRLVKLVQQSLAPLGAKVTESVMVANGSGSREIDVLVEGDFGMYRMKIAVEAKDHSRALDVTAIEQIACKYRPGDGILVNQVVIVSKSGFTREAAEKAKRSNIELLTLREAEAKDWADRIPAGENQSLHFQLPPHLHRVAIEPKPPNGDMRTIVTEGRWVCESCGRNHGTVLETAQKLVSERILKDSHHREEIRKALPQHKGSVLVTVRGQYTNRFIDFRGTRYPVNEIIVEVHIVDAVAPMQFTTYEQIQSDGTKRFVQRATADVAGKRVQMVMPNGLKSEKVVVDISSIESDMSCGCSAERAA